jgi:5-methylthioadenosine/S-adenosylhomocysteine deaminase
MIVFDTKRPHLVPLYNPYSQLVYSARGNDVTHSMINGRLVMENRKLLSLDLAEILKRAKEEAQRVLTWVSKS